MSTEKKQKKKKKKSNLALNLAIVICLIVMAVAIYKLVTIQLTYKAGRDEYQSLQQYTVQTEKTEEASEESGSSSAEPAETAAKAPISVDFTALQAINPDIVGWLYIGALDISYPIVQGEDNDYYLHRTFEGQSNFSGSIFMECKNNGDFLDPNTILYGHNMKDQSMFGRLKFLNEREGYLDDPVFWVLTPEQDYKYQIFSLQYTMSNSEVYTLFSGAGQEVLDYLNARKAESSKTLPEVELTEHSRVVTLSTCASSTGEQRFVVQGVCVNV